MIQNKRTRPQRSVEPERTKRHITYKNGYNTQFTQQSWCVPATVSSSTAVKVFWTAIVYCCLDHDGGDSSNCSVWMRSAVIVGLYYWIFRTVFSCNSELVRDHHWLAGWFPWYRHHEGQYVAISYAEQTWFIDVLEHFQMFSDFHDYS